MVTTRSDHDVARAVGEDLPGPDVAGDEHEARREPAGHRGDLGGDAVGVVHPLVLGVVLEPVVRPAADLDLLDLEAVAVDGLLLLGLAGGADVGDVGPDAVGHHDDVRHPARGAGGAPAGDRAAATTRRPRGRGVDEGRSRGRPSRRRRPPGPGPSACRPGRRRCPRAAGRAPPRRPPPGAPCSASCSATARTRSSSSVSAFSVVCVTSAQTVAYGPGTAKTGSRKDTSMGGTTPRCRSDAGRHRHRGVAVAAYPPTGPHTRCRMPGGGGRRFGPEPDRSTRGRRMTERDDLPLHDYDHLHVGSLISRIRTPGRRPTCRPCSPTSRAHANRIQVVSAMQNRLTGLKEGAQPSGGDPAAAGAERRRRPRAGRRRPRPRPARRSTRRPTATRPTPRSPGDQRPVRRTRGHQPLIARTSRCATASPRRQ